MSLEEFAKKRFLIVDELESFRFSTKKTLMTFGLKMVDTATSAQNVVSGFQNVNYDVILCNYDLGKGKNGQELLEELRYKKLLKFSSLFFIVTAEVDRSKVMGTVENEPDGYLVKPIAPNDLKQRLSKALKMKEAMKAIDTAIDEGDYHSSIAYCDEKIAEKGSYVLRCMKTKAWLLSKLGHIDEARELYEGILKSNDFTWAEYGLARILIRRKHYEEAEKLLRAIIKKDPDQVEALDLLALVLQRQEKTKDAQATVEKAISRSPNSLHRQKQFAELCAENEDNNTAIEAYQKMMKLSEQSVYAKPQHCFDFANYLADVAKDQEGETGNNPRVKEALELLDESVKRFSDIPNIEEQSKLVAANVNATIGNADEANTLLNELLGEEQKADNLSAKSLKLAAQALTTLGDEDKAELFLEKAADLAKEDSELVEGIYTQLNQGIGTETRKQAALINKQGIRLYNDKKIQEAADELKRALPLTPRHISLNLNLAQVLLRLYKRTAEVSLLKEVDDYLHRVRHIPRHHKEYLRYQYLVDRRTGMDEAKD
jgi:tetratricopeptide (TPR) repeat protein